MITRKYLEFDVVPHCNLRCVGCGHGSEMAAPSFYSVWQYAAEIKLLAEVMHVKEFRLMGGEPLLHKQLPEFVRIAKEVGIADVVSICTNAELVNNFGDELYSLLDKVDVTMYPNTGIEYDEKIAYLSMMQQTHKFELNIGFTREFTKIHSPIERTDEQTKQTFDECKVAHEWGCHTFKDGRYYKCILPTLHNELLDGVDLTGPELETQLIWYLGSTTPMKSCKKCFGTSGETFTHHQVDPIIKRNKKAK